MRKRENGRGIEMKKRIALVGTLDTKGREYAFIKKAIEGRGLDTLVIDAGI